MSLLRALLNCLFKHSKKSRSRRLRANRDRFAFERFEARRVLATVSDDGPTLNIVLAANEALTVKSNDTAYLFTSNQSFSQASVAAGNDFSAFGQDTLSLNSSGLARYSTINITDAAAGARITFVDSGSSQFFDSINVMLDSGSTAPLTWEGRTLFAAGQSLSVSTQASIVLGAAATVEASTIVMNAADGITLGGGIYSPSGQVTLNADADGNGVGTLTLEDSSINNFVPTGTLVDEEPGEQFFYGIGRALSGDGNTLAIVSDKTNANGQPKLGGLFIYTKSGSTWSLQQKIVLNTDFPELFAKVSLSYDGNTLLMGNYGAIVDNFGAAGLVIVFTRSGSNWSEQARLFAPVSAVGNYFGSSVALTPDGNSAIVTAPRYKVGANDLQGAAFVYVRNGNTWTHTQSLIKSNGVAGEYFGHQIAISRDGTTAVITANTVGMGIGLGSAVVYTRNGNDWQPQQIVVSDDRHVNDGFGRSVDLSADGNILVVGAPFYRVSGYFSQHGGVYVFLRSGNTWVQHQKLLQPQGTSDEDFGGSVAISADGQLILTYSVFPSVLAPDLADGHIFVRRGPTWDYFQNIEAGGGVLMNAEGTHAIVTSSSEHQSFAYQGIATSLHSPRDRANEKAGWVKSQGDLIVTAADFDLRGNIQSQSKLYVNRSQSSRVIDVGTDSANNVGLTASEFNRLVAPNLIIGRDPQSGLTGPVLISSPIVMNYAASKELELAAGNSSDIAFTASGSITTRDANLLLRLEGTGSVLSSDAVTDINTGTGILSFELASGSVGQSNNPITFSAPEINSFATGSADQFFSTEGTVAIGAMGLSAGTGNIQLIKGTWNQVANEQIDDNSGVVLAGATWDLKSFRETISRWTGHSGFVTGFSGLLNVNSQVQTNGVSINTRIQTIHGLRKFGNSTTTIMRSQAYSGSTIVESGTLHSSASFISPNSKLVDLQSAGVLVFVTGWSMSTGQVLQGSGFINGGLSTGVNSRIAPGPSAAVLNTRDIVLASGILDIEILGPSTNEYDQLNIKGTVRASGNLNLIVPPTAAIPFGSQFKIINNDGTDAVSGSFINLPEGAAISVGTGADARSFQITYRGGDGNDVVLTAMPTLTLSIAPAVISEKNGLATATVSRAGADTSTALTVSLLSSDTSEARVPASVVIPIGATTATFNVSAVDDNLLDGPQNVIITTLASNFVNGTNALQVLDEEVLSITVSQASISENGGSAIGTVTRSNTDIAGSLLVTLSTSDTSEAVVPATVLIPANQSSATFAIDAVDDALLDGSIVVTIAGAASGYLSVSDSLTITDYETLGLSLSASSMSELDGTVIGTITRNNTDNAQALTIALASSDTSEATVPAVVTIPAGQTSLTFPVASVDDALLDGLQTVVISATANGYVGDSQSLDVVDFEQLTLSIVANSINERGQTTQATVTRTDGTGPLTIQFASNDITEAVVPVSITLDAGQLTGTFVVTAMDDSFLDGSQSVTITASASTYVPASQDITVDDYEDLQLTLQSTLISEWNGFTTGTVIRSNADTNSPLTVLLASTDLSEASVPSSVVIPAGRSSVKFLIQAADDALLDGRQTLSLLASSPGYVSGTVELRVEDYETLRMVLSQETISENNGSATATVTRSNTDNALPLTVDILSSDTSEATVPATVVIPAGQATATFTINAQDDAILDGTQSLLVRVAATNYVSDILSLMVTDYETLTVSVDRTIINEQGGLATGTVRRSNTDIAQPLTVTLVNGDTSEVAMPATVTIAANQTSASFSITALDDGLDDGAQTVSLGASATGYSVVAGSIIVVDGVALALSFDVNAISELGGRAVGTVTRANSDTANDLVVALSSSDTSEASVPASVTIRAGAQTATFTLLAIDDALLDGTQLVTITAQAPSMTPSRSTLSITDYETLSLQIDRASMSEAGGQAVGIVSRSNIDLSRDLIVDLLASDTGEATVPSSVTIPANQSSVTFVVSAVDDALLDGTQRVAISAAASGYIGLSQVIDVIDVEALSLTIQANSISEKDGTTTGVVTRSNSDNTVSLVVTLLSSDTSELSAPISVTIPGGQSSASFEISAVDDALLDGSQSVTISASAIGYAAANRSITVSDFESLQLSFSAGNMSENGGSMTGTVTRSNTDIGLPLVVSLVTSDATEAIVAASVVIPANQASVTFALTALDDTLLDGNQTVSITATAAGYQAANASLVVTDHEVLTLSLQTSSISEAGGNTTGTITRSNTDTAAALVVTLVNGDLSELNLPPIVTIPAGQSSVNFSVTAQDDTLLDGSQTVSFDANALGYVGATISINVMDAESLTLALGNDSMSEAGGTGSAVVSRSNSDIQSALIVHLLSSDPSDAQVPATVTIPAGQQSVAFTITAIDDALLDGIQTAIISVSSAGYSSSSQALAITDAERLTVTILPEAINERGGKAIGTVTRSNTDAGSPLTVNLTSSDNSEAVVPTTVVIPAGQNSSTFTVTAVDDTLLDGLQTLSVSADASGYSAGQHELAVTDFETLTLVLSTSEVSEDSGSLTVTVTRNNSDLGKPLTITFENSNPSQLTLPTTVVMPAGQSTISLAATIVDDTLLDGPQTVIVMANADGYESSARSVQILDAESLSLSAGATSLSEAGGVVTLFISRSNSDIAQALVVTLVGSDATELNIPSTVSIPANEVEVAIVLTAVDDNLLDGPQSVLVSASAEGYAAATQSLTVLDSESLTVHLSKLSMREAGGVLSGSVTRSNSDTFSALVVNLSSSDASEATLPGSVTIPAGQASAFFTVTSVDDQLLDGTQRVSLDATALGYTSALVELDVTDVESLDLVIHVGTVTENGAAATATITRSNSNTNQPLEVSLVSSDSTQIDLPAAVTIPVGSQSVSFEIQAVKDRLLDGLQVVLIEARAAGYESDMSTISVADGEALSLTIDVSSISERNGRAVGRVTRNNTDNQVPLTVQLVGSNSAQAEVPTSVVIPSGASFATFTITAVNDAVVDGTQVIEIAANSGGYVSAQASLEVTDDDRLRPWNNPRNVLDVNDSGQVTALDALLVINALNTRFQLTPTLPEPFDPVQYLDVDANGLVTPLDALLVINELNRPRSGEGEQAVIENPAVLSVDLSELEARKPAALLARARKGSKLEFIGQ